MQSFAPRCDRNPACGRSAKAAFGLFMGWLGVVSLSANLHAASPADYLPAGETFAPEVSSPESALAFSIGDRHIHHHELVSYFRTLASQSDRAEYFEYGRTHGDRPLPYLIISSPANLARLDEIREQRQRLSDPARSEGVDVEAVPAVVNMGYSVHGDEASGGNAAPVVAYWLCAGQSERVRKLLDDLVIIVDPCLNPDGFERFAQWVNSHRGRVANPDPATAEHNQPFPGGRVNYYWFDLNRDWMPAQHPESQGRLKLYREWMPNLLLDFHEMGPSSTYYFPPGEPLRNHPRIPQTSLDFSEKLAGFHARALDRLGVLYFSGQGFDDFYPGKGATYPELHGGVGTLFEQSSSQGQTRETPFGIVRFADTIRSHVATSVSSLEGARQLRPKMNEYLRQFYVDALEEGRRDAHAWRAFAAPGDAERLRTFQLILVQHGVQTHWLDRDWTTGDLTLPARFTLMVPSAQPEYRYLMAMIESRTEFAENIFYDISAWDLPLAFDLDVHELEEAPPANLLVNELLSRESFPDDEDVYAYLLTPHSSDTPRRLQHLLSAGVKVLAAGEPFELEVRGTLTKFPAGTLSAPLGIQDNREGTKAAFSALASDGAQIWAAPTGRTASGINLGSGLMKPVTAPRIALLIDEGVDRYSAGAIWHWLDTRVDAPVTLISTGRLGRTSLDRYTTVILPDGSYSGLSSSAIEKLSSWVSAGGTLIACGRGCGWAIDHKLTTVERVSGVKSSRSSAEPRPYRNAADDKALEAISGAIFAVKADLTHPLCWGLSDERFAVFRDHTVALQPTKSVYSTPVRYAKSPLLSGYCSAENNQKLAGSGSVAVTGKGAGRVVLLAEELMFRGYWYGGARILTNAIYYGSLIRDP